MGVPQSAITSIARDIAALLTLIAELAYTSMGQPREAHAWVLAAHVSAGLPRETGAVRSTAA